MSVLPPLTGLLEQRVIGDLVLTLDLAGTFVFAISGAMLGVRRGLDLFGVLVLSVAAASAGGIIRDVLIGAIPPAAIVDWRYFAVAILSGLMIFYWYSPISKLRMAILVFDAAGLALFAVSGATKAIAFGLNPMMSALLGMVTGIGGGITRDLLVVRTPVVLKRDFYAVAALAGSTLVVVGDQLGSPAIATAVFAALACFAFRVVAIRRGWGLPQARHTPADDGQDHD